MIVPVPRSAGASEENVLPLINIVFLLLIFFMIAGSLSAATPFEVEPPAAGSAAATETPRGGVAIAGDGRLAFAGEPIALGKLAEHAGRWRETRGGDRPLAVQADADAPTERLLAVIDALREAGIERIRLLAAGASRDG